MSHKRLPYLFLSLLLLILFFVVGLRWGQNIEKTNKIVNYLISIPPTATIFPTQPLLEFTTYKHVGCGISFLHPSLFKLEKESTEEARFVENGHLALFFSCFPQTIKNRPTTNPDWIITFQNQKITKQIYEKDIEVYMLKNPQNGKFITFYSQERIYPLLEKSLEFLAK